MVNFTAADRVGSIGGYLGGIEALGRLFGGFGGRGELFGGRGYGREDDCGGNKYNHKVTEHELNLVRENAAQAAVIAGLQSEKYTDNKVSYLAERVCALEKYAAVTATHEKDFERYVEAEFIHQPKAAIRESIVVCRQCGCENCCCGNKERGHYYDRG